jgi:hypothetical protein
MLLQAVQIVRFGTGGFCTHKLQLNGQQYSAWFSPSGKLLDAEKTGYADGHTVSVSRRHSGIRHALEQIAHKYVV